MKKGIIGCGGFGREVYWSLPIEYRKDCMFFVEDSYYANQQKNLLPLSKLNINEYEVIVAIADSKTRKRIVESLPSNTKFFTHIHHSAQIHDENIIIGEGSIICAGAIITTNVIIGKHAQINLNTTIGHDNIIGDYFTTAPMVHISGNCQIGNEVYFGSLSGVKQRINICSNVIIGMGSCVIKNITESGIYIGTPAQIKIKR